VELVIAVTMSTMVIAGLVYFLTQINTDISTAQYKTDVYLQLSDFTSKVNTARANYQTGKILVDLPKDQGYDVLLLTNTGKTAGAIVGVANMSDAGTGLLDSGTNFTSYGNKMLAVQEISSGMLATIVSNTGLVNTGVLYSLPINSDQTFPNLQVSRFSIKAFNS